MRRAILVIVSTTLLFVSQAAARAAKKPPPSHKPVDPCHAYPIDVFQTWVVTDTETNFYSPGSSDRGPTVDLAQRRYSILINNTYPGPTLRAKVNDWIRVDVLNMMVSRPVSVHWHGIAQKGTPWADGTGMVTNCVILPSGSGGAPTFSYIFQATAAGTFWYHGHAALEAEYGVAGSIIITDPNDPLEKYYDLELAEPIHVNDWWRDPDVEYALMGAYNYYGTLDGALTNGFYGNGSETFPNVVIAEMQQGLCYRIRFVNGNNEWEGWSPAITRPDGTPQPMTVVAVNAHDIQPINVNAFYFYAAERVDTVLCADGPLGNYTLTFSTVQNIGTCQFIDGCQNTTRAFIRVVPRIHAASTVNRTVLAAFPKVAVLDTMTDYRKLKPQPAAPPPTHAEHTWTMQMGFSYAAYLWEYRSRATVLPSAPYLFTKGKCGTFPDTLVKTVPVLGTVVDIIINNLNNGLHIVHTHGNNFWVLGSGFYTDAGANLSPTNQTLCPEHWLGADPSVNAASTSSGSWGCPYNANRDATLLNLVDPYMTESVPVPAQGWVYLRIKLDNPGTWYVHCHLNNHMLQGMGFLMDVAPSQQPPIPAWVNTRCGGTCAPAADQQCGPFSPPLAARAKETCDAMCPGGYGYCTGTTPAAYTPLSGPMG